AHLRSCADCSDLISDLEFIARQAPLLQVDEDPSPRVWNSLELVLRSEGVIRAPKPAPAPKVGFWHWRPARAVLMAAAVVLVAVGIVVNQRTQAPRIVADSPIPANLAAPMAPEDQQFLETVSSLPPAVRTAYESNLRDVNAYIHDAEESA